MSYTVHCDKKIDNKIHEDLQLIVKGILDLLKEHVYAILLFGGFGRGEGSVKINNGKISIVNDYDIAIVLNESQFKYLRLSKKYNPLLNQLAGHLAQKLQIKQIDFSLQSISSYNKPNSLKIVNYELLLGHKVLFGNENPCKFMPDYMANDIPLIEGTWLFRNRGGGLLLAAKYFMKNGNISLEKRENFIIECNKALLAIGDSILLSRRKYHHLYSERLNIINQIDITDIPSHESIKSSYINALKQKLRPDFKQYETIDLRKWWFEVVKLFSTFFLYFEGVRLDREINSWLEYSSFSKLENKLDIKELLRYFVRNRQSGFNFKALKKGLVKARSGKFINLMALLLFSIEKDGVVNEDYITIAKKLLGSFSNKTSLDLWENLTDQYLLLWHPEGEIINVIEEDKAFRRSESGKV